MPTKERWNVLWFVVYWCSDLTRKIAKGYRGIFEVKVVVGGWVSIKIQPFSAMYTDKN